MKLFLKKNVSELGEIGDVIDVKPGYARNYLIPQGIGVEVGQANLQWRRPHRAAETEYNKCTDQSGEQHHFGPNDLHHSYVDIAYGGLIIPVLVAMIVITRFPGET